MFRIKVVEGVGSLGKCAACGWGWVCACVFVCDRMDILIGEPAMFKVCQVPNNPDVLLISGRHAVNRLSLVSWPTLR